MSYRKPFDPVLHERTHDLSITAMKKWVVKMDCRNCVDETATNQYGFDGSFIDVDGVKYYCELALRLNWEYGRKPFPFDTIHYEERKIRYLKEPYCSLKWIYMVVRQDGAGVCVLLDPVPALKARPVVTKPNRLCDDPNGENFYDIKTSRFEYWRL